MNEELNGASFFTQLLRNTAAIFTLSVLVISIAGILLTRFDSHYRETYSLFALAPLGLTYNTILQIAGGSIMLAAISAWLFSERFIYKMRFLTRTVIFLLMTFIIFSLFAVIFKWFPVNEPMVWIKFFISTFVCFFISIGITLVKQKLEGKKYNELLESYKGRHNINH